MEELVIKIGEMLDEKLETKMGQLLDEKLETKVGQVIDEKLDAKLQQMSDDFCAQIAELREDMMDQFFLFESEYGNRILAIGDSALLDNEKNRERSKKMHELEERMNRNEVRIDACQNDIFKLKQRLI